MEDAAIEDRHEAARGVIRQFGVGEHWKAVIDPDLPPALMALTHATLDAYERTDLDWLLAHTAPELVITQPPEFPDTRIYTGKDALLNCLLDWPRQWRDFRMEPRRIFAVGEDDLVMVSLHRGRPHTIDIEVEAEIVFLLHWRDDLVARWDMFLSIDEALEAARAD
jgi:ketosteroid isomerase-like protein